MLVIVRILLSLVVISAWFSLSAGGSSVGTNAADFLMINTDARVAAMANSGVAIMDNDASHLNNPGVLGSAFNRQVNLSTMKLNGFEDGIGGAKMFQSGVVYSTTPRPGGFGPFLSYGSMAFDLVYVDYGDIPITSNTPDAIGSFTARNMVASASWGNRLERHKLARNIPFGISLKYIYQGYGQFASSHGVATDLGGAYVFSRSSKLNGLSFGTSILNLGFASAFIEESDPLPTTFKSGIAYKFFMNSIVHFFGGPKKLLKSKKEDGLLSLEVSKSLANDVIVAIGSEFTFIDMLSIRSGYQFLEDDRGVTLGFGIAPNSRSIKFKMDFAWVPQSLLGDNFRVTLKYAFSSDSIRNRKLSPVLDESNADEKKKRESRKIKFRSASDLDDEE